LTEFTALFISNFSSKFSAKTKSDEKRRKGCFKNSFGT